MGITAQTKFLINYDDNNAFSIIEFDKGKVTTNEISIGLNTLTIQTLIHEINETELCFILNKIGFNKDIKIRYHKKDAFNNNRYFVTHLLSPHGRNTLISPTKYSYYDTQKPNFNIAKYEEVLNKC
jgi:hypothetical protein